MTTPATRPPRLGQAQRLGNLGWSEWDLVTGAVRWSGQLYALFGRAPGQEVPPAAFTDLVVPEDRALAENLLHTLLHRREPADVELRFSDPVRHVRVMAEPVLDPAGEPILLRAVCQDVTSCRRSERLLADSQRALERSRGRIAEERHIALELQHAILPLPRRPIRLPGVRVACRYLPAESENRVGGDWYEAAELPGGEVFRPSATCPATGWARSGRRTPTTTPAWWPCWSSDPGHGSMAGVPGLMLLDTPSLYFRAFFGVPESVKAPDGTPVNAVRGLIDMIARLVTDRRPERLVCCMDANWRPDFRVEALPSYKAHRVAYGDVEETPSSLEDQLPIIDDVLEALGLLRLDAPGYEADDVIGTLAVQHGRGGPVDIVTGDRDLFQLADDNGPVLILYTARGIRNLQYMGEKEVGDKYGIPGRGYAEFATLRGDPSDGLPGVPGIGEKTAAALVTRFGTVEAMLAAIDAGQTDGFPAGSRLKLAGARDYLAAAETVVRVVTDITLPDFDDRLPSTPRDPEKLLELVDRWNLSSPVNRLLKALAG